MVSGLFCDLVGCTAASEQADPEDVAGAVEAEFGRVVLSKRGV